MNEPQLFQRKPTRLYAMRYIDSCAYTNIKALQKWTNEQFSVKSDVEMELDLDSSITAFVYDTLHDTWVGVKDGDWIIEGIAGEFYPHDGELFPQNYEEVAE